MMLNNSVEPTLPFYGSASQALRFQLLAHGNVPTDIALASMDLSVFRSRVPLRPVV